MANQPYLAMTAAEFSACDRLPEHPAWMACHFSPYGRGLSNIPKTLPPGSMLILNDRIEPQAIDPSLVAQQVRQTVQDLGCEAVLLDLQRPGNPLTQAVAKAVCEALSCPLAVSSAYAEALSCAVFLPPPPLRCDLAQYFAPWQDRQIWLELYDQWETVTVTADAVQVNDEPPGKASPMCHFDSKFHCRYTVETFEDRAVFTLHRGMDELKALPYPVSKYIALWQDYRG